MQEKWKLGRGSQRLFSVNFVVKIIVLDSAEPIGGLVCTVHFLYILFGDPW